MYSYNREKLEAILLSIIRRYTDTSQLGTQFSTVFITIPRKTGKSLISVSEEEKSEISKSRPGLHITGWSIDRLTRVWWLIRLDPSNQKTYVETIENLFLTGEMNELVALYSALPVIAYPEIWKARCAEGIRNNIDDVLRSIICNNPYPSENLDEGAWNQLVLKAFFTGKPIDQIIGLEKRANETLARTLYDYAKERLSANRTVDPALWTCVAPFASEETFPDYQKIKDYVLQS